MIKNSPLDKREIFPPQVGKYREIAGKSARKCLYNMNNIYNINRLYKDKIFAPFHREKAGTPVPLNLPLPVGPGAPGGFFFAPPYSYSFPSSCLGTPIYRAAPASPLLIFSTCMAEPHAPAFLPWPPPAKRTRHQREFSAKKPRNQREKCPENINNCNVINKIYCDKIFASH